MSLTITDSQLATLFAQSKGPVEVRSSDGRLLGMFTPDMRESTISEEELHRREEDRQAKHFTAAEVEARLRELRCTQ